MDLSRQFWYFSNMAAIETYNLFGEYDDLPDVVHCETIEARSVHHNWAFRPHRHGRLHQFLLIERGRGQVQIDGRVTDLTDGSLVNVPKGSVHGFEFAPGTKGWVITIASEVLDDALHEGEGLIAVLRNAAVVTVDNTRDPEGAATTATVKALFAEYPRRAFARAHILRALAGVLAGQVARQVARQLAESAPSATGTTHPLQRRFEALLEDHYRDHWTVADYATALAVSPTHLSRTLRQAVGRSAQGMIEERLMQEARRYLAFSNQTIAEVGYALGFGDPAYFSRVFRRATGQSPSQFRAAFTHQADERGRSHGGADQA